jgi:hypothetical protein
MHSSFSSIHHYHDAHQHGAQVILLVIIQLMLYIIISVNPVHNAPHLSVTGFGVQADRTRRGGWGSERSVTNRPNPIFRSLLHRPLPSPTPRNFRHRHKDLLN